MSTTKQTYLYGRCFITHQTPDLTPFRYLKKHAPSTHIACYPASTLIIIRVIKDEIIHLLKTTENPNLYTFHHKHGTVPPGTYVLAEEAWTRPRDITADYEPLTKDRIETQVQQLIKPRRSATRAQWSNIVMGSQQRAGKKKVSTYV
jgi:hypothetical protein